MSTINQALTTQRPANMSSFQIGDAVGDYRITETLGLGASGQVFRVEHTVTRRVEAMKVLIDGRTGQRDLAQRFLREIKVQASLNHPGIASVYNAFWVKDDLVMIMELVQGRPLSRILERERLPTATSLDYISQALAALQYAHVHGVIHRDISPNNLMVTPGGSLKVTDFGLAKTPNEQHLTATGAVLGTVHYMSPEQVRGLPADMRSDVYSAACVLYELAAGRKPFEGANSFAVMQAHVEDEPQAPSSLNATIPRSLDAAILRALSKRPEDRFQTAEEFRRALEEVQRDIGGRRREAQVPASQSAPRDRSTEAAVAASAPSARISPAGVIAIAAVTCLISFGGYAAVTHFSGATGHTAKGPQAAATLQLATPLEPAPSPSALTAPTEPAPDPLAVKHSARLAVAKPAPQGRVAPSPAMRAQSEETRVSTAPSENAIRGTISEPPPVLSSAPAALVPPPAAAAHAPDMTALQAPPKPVSEVDDEPTKRKPGRVKRMFGRILGRNRSDDSNQ